jgi:hypothetical protein
MGAGHNGYSIPGIDLKIKKEGGADAFPGSGINRCQEKISKEFLIYC